MSSPLGANVFITGANRGIGLGLVKKMLTVGGLKNVFAGCRDVDSAAELQQLYDKNGPLRLIRIDVSDDRSIRMAFGQVQKQLLDKGGLNLLINNAGILLKEGVSLREPIRDTFLHHFDVNTVGPVMTTAAFLPLLKKAASAGEFARVVNIGSSLGCIGQAAVSPRLSPYQNVAYGMSKAALHHFSKMMALDESDIVTVAIHPGWVKTEMGGANATMSVSDSVAKIMARICALTKSDSGKLLYGEKELLP
ncbi:hypothetical protein niasHS_014972 [Heterodera schachtii]|uniref:C-factor n=2 Tax=Heterodera TaxID=34509 RepID=A0ABD2IPL4_HETSC